MASEIICSKCGRIVHHCKCAEIAGKVGVAIAVKDVDYYCDLPLKAHPFDGYGKPIALIEYPRFFCWIGNPLAGRYFEIIRFQSEDDTAIDRQSVCWALSEVLSVPECWQEVEVRPLVRK